MEAKHVGLEVFHCILWHLITAADWSLPQIKSRCERALHPCSGNGNGHPDTLLSSRGLHDNTIGTGLRSANLETLNRHHS